MKEFKINSKRKEGLYYHWENYTTKVLKWLPMLITREEVSNDFIQGYFNWLKDIEDGKFKEVIKT